MHFVPKSATTAFAALAAVCVLPSVSLACSCMQRSAAEQVRASDVIFKGRATRTSAEPGGGKVTRFRVLETLKGETGREARVSHPANSGVCGPSFERGRSVLVMATRVDGRLQTNLCVMPQHGEPAIRAALGRSSKAVSP